MRTKPFYLALSIVLWSVLTAAQQPRTPQSGTARAHGNCSPATAGNNNLFYFKYCGGDPAQEHKIIELLSRILQNKDSASLNQKLDELLSIASKPSQSQTCFGSNCVLGGNQTVDARQFGVPQPPPNLIDIVYKETPPLDIKPPQFAAEGEMAKHPGAEATFKIDRVFSNAIFLAHCSRPCVATYSSASVSGTFMPQSLQTNDPTIVGFVIGLSSPLWAGTHIKLSVRSLDDSPVTISDVKPYVPPVQ